MTDRTLTDQELEECARIVGTEASEPGLRRHFDSLLGAAVSLLGAREQALTRKERDRHHEQVATAARRLRALLQDGPPYAVANLWEEGLRWCTPLPPEVGPPSGSHTVDLHWLTDQLQRIEDVALRASMKIEGDGSGGRRPQTQRRLIAELAVHEYLTRRPSGTKSGARDFTEFIINAAAARVTNERDFGVGMRRHVDVAWDIYRAKLGR